MYITQNDDPWICRWFSEHHTISSDCRASYSVSMFYRTAPANAPAGSVGASAVLHAARHGRVVEVHVVSSEQPLTRETKHKTKNTWFYGITLASQLPVRSGWRRRPHRAADVTLGALCVSTDQSQSQHSRKAAVNH